MKFINYCYLFIFHLGLSDFPSLHISALDKMEQQRCELESQNSFLGLCLLASTGANAACDRFERVSSQQ